jgi:DNA-binding GntR family transcriptional regulator
LKAPGRTAASLAELSELIEALMSGDGAAAREAGIRHVRNAADAAIALLRAEQEAPAD